MAIFDRLAERTFNRITNLYGVPAVWLRSKRRQHPGKVLFKNPTEAVQIGDSENYEYRPNTATIEYYRGTFDGLKESVDQGKSEYVTVNGQKYAVQEVTTRSDGNTYIAHLEPSE